MGGARWSANFRTPSRPAQFYAAKTLIYGKDGEPLSLETSAQIVLLVRNEPLLVLVSPDKRTLLTTPELRVEEIARNGKTQLVLVRRAAS